MSELERLAARMICIGFDGPRLTDDARALLRRGVSAVVLFTRNFTSRDQLRQLSREIKSASVGHRPVLICTDHEGGRVQRFRGDGISAIPSMREIGAAGDVERARAIGELMARDLRAMDIDMNLAPVLDVDSNPKNPVIGERSFGSDPDQVARMGCAMIEGLQAGPREAASANHTSACVAACGKHFPGHGDTAIDSHLDLPRLSHGMDRLKRVELVPFAAAIQAGVAAIMTSHVIFEPLDGHFPATLSPAVLDGILRKRLGFDGAVISDDMEMKAIADHFGFDEAIVRGAIAGIDLFLVCHTPAFQHRAIDALVEAADRGEISHQHIGQSIMRLDVLFARFVRSDVQ